MKISDNFTKLKEEKALVIVTGKQDAIFYGIEGGRIEKLDAFKIPTPRYSDNEGYTKVRGKGMTFSSGWVRELKDEDVIKEFLLEFKERIKKIPNGWKKVYLFVPSQNKNDVREALPKSYAEKLEKEINGNYFYRSPQDLLELLKEEA